MRRKRYAEHTRFLALRACWSILRGESVAWNLNVTDDGFESLGGGLFAVGCADHGEPMTAGNFSFAEPEEQEL